LASSSSTAAAASTGALSSKALDEARGMAADEALDDEVATLVADA
jgi:hypothetical protein